MTSQTHCKESRFWLSRLQGVYQMEGDGMVEEESVQASDNSDASVVIDTCTRCSKRFTAYANGPSDVERGQPYRHERFPNDVLCWDCFQRAEQLADGANGPAERELRIEASTVVGGKTFEMKLLLTREQTSDISALERLVTMWAKSVVYSVEKVHREASQ